MTNSHLPHFPNEILYEIVGHVDDDDLLNLRLSAKVFQCITADRFTTTFFETRAYELSRGGLKALVKITEHPVFASHIRTVIIGHGGKYSSAKYHDMLEQAFRNLTTLGNPISLGLRRVRTSHNHEDIAHRGSHAMNKFLQQKMMPAAMRAQLPLKEIVVDVQSNSQDRLLPSNSDVWAGGFIYVVTLGVMGNGQLGGLQIKLSATGLDPSRPGYISINIQDKRLEGSQACIIDMNYHMAYVFTRDLREIELGECEVDRRWLLNALALYRHQLQRLSLYDIRLSQPSWNAVGYQTWLPVFAAATTSLSVLKSCKFGRLWEGNGNLWLEGGDKTLEASTQTQASTILSNLAIGVRTFTLDG